MADEPVDLSALSPEDQQIARTLAARTNGGQSLQTAQDLQNLPGQVLRDPYGVIPHAPGEGLRAGMGVAQQNIANLPMRVARGLGAQPGGLGEMAGAAASGALNFVTSPFGTPEGTAVAGAMAPLRAAAQLPGVRDLPALVRGGLAQTGVLGAVGGTAAGLTGGDTIKGTAEGVGAGAFGAIVGKISQHFAQKKQDVLDFAKGVVKDVPWLGDLIPQTAKTAGAGEIGPLLAVRGALNEGGMVGQKLLSDKFLPVKNEVMAAVGKNPIEVPAADATIATTIMKKLSNESGGKIDPSTAQFVYNQMQNQGMLQSKTMTIEQALDEVVRLKALANKAPDGGVGWTARERARQFQARIDAAVKEHGGDDLLARYVADRRQYGKGMSILNLLDNDQSGIFKLTKGGGQLDVAKLQNYIANNIDEYGPLRFPALNQAATRGAPLGSGDVPVSLRMPRIFSHGISETAPAMSLPGRTGQTGAPDMGNPAAGIRPAMGALMLPEWALQQPPQSPVTGQP